LSRLKGTDEKAAVAIGTMVTEEREHHDRSAVHIQSGHFWEKVLSPIVGTSTEAVIWLGMHL